MSGNVKSYILNPEHSKMLYLDHDWSAIPEKYHEAIQRWILYATQPGDHFLRSLLKGNVRGMYVYAKDLDFEQAFLYQMIEFLYTTVPGNCWGDEKYYKEWMKSGGLVGLNP